MQAVQAVWAVIAMATARLQLSDLGSTTLTCETMIVVLIQKLASVSTKENAPRQELTVKRYIRGPRKMLSGCAGKGMLRLT